jgi:pimeloyl-ACP methyl ester carboxylesterase
MSLHKNEDAAKWKPKCAPVAGTKAEACLYETGGKRQGTLMYGHGLADSVKTIEASIYPHEGLIDFIKSTDLSHVLVVSYGKDWMLKPTGDSEKSVNEYVRILESFKTPRPFIGVGISMGGSNMASIAMQRPEFFDRVVLAHPMLVKDDQYHAGWGFLPGFIVDNHFSREEWKLANPFAQAEGVKKLPKMMVIACAKDSFKLYEGTAEWVMVLRKLTIIPSPKWMPYVDGCSHSSPKFDEVLEFIQ